jgi:hypothetical protein
MLSIRSRNLVDNLITSPLKPKITKRKLPIDFFEHSTSLDIRKSQ